MQFCQIVIVSLHKAQIVMKIGITNLKGGVGKTTLTQNLAVCLSHLNYTVCIVDTDENHNSISWSGVRDESVPEILVVGATDDRALSKQVQNLEKHYDFVLIDGTPHLGEMTTRIILASDILIIPILASAHDVRSVKQFLERLDQAKEFRPKITTYFFLNLFQGFSVQNSVVEILKSFEIPILESNFRNRVAYIESAVEGRGVLEWTDEKAASEAANLTKEVLKIVDGLHGLE